MSKQTFTKKAFDELLNEKKFMGTKCNDCQTLYLPPRPMCKKCFSDNMKWVAMPTKGQLKAFTVVHIAPTAMLKAGYGRDHPYISGIVTLENGLAISAQILGLDPSKPEEIEIGTPVKAEFVARGENEEEMKTLLAFRPE